MIKSLKLTNWKSFGEATLYVDPLTILIGTNASGKSNVLDALIFLRNIARGEALSAVFTGDGSIGDGVRGGTEWAIRQDQKRARLEVVLTHLEDQQTEYHYGLELEMLDESRIEIVSEYLNRLRKHKTTGKPYERKLFYTDETDPNQPSIAVRFATNKRGPHKRVDLRRSYSVISQARTIPLTDDVEEGIEELLHALSAIFVFDPIPSLIRDYAKISDELQPNGANTAGVLAALSPFDKNRIEATLVKYLRQLPEKEVNRIWTEAVGRFKTDAMLYCEETWGNGHATIVDARGMSDGTLRLISIMTALLTIRSHSLLVVEEIDNGMHPSRARLLVDFLREIGSERNIDIICTTHNPALLDAFGNEMIPFISLVYREDNTGNSAIKLLEELDHLPRLMARGSVGKLVTRGALEKALHS